jgi:hypothetical protein
VTRFSFQESLPKFCSNFTKLRKILPNVGFPSNYVIIMPKNNSCVMKVEKICTKRYLKILVAFIPLQFLLMIRLYFLGLAVLFITYTFAKSFSNDVTLFRAVPLSELYTWKADFSQWRNQKVKPNMADFEAILARHSQSPTRAAKHFLGSDGSATLGLCFSSF